MSVHKRILCFLCLLVVLVCLAGCSGLKQYRTVESPLLTLDEENRVGDVVADRLVQLLGGHYHDKALADDLNRLSRLQSQGDYRLRVFVADRGKAVFYPLPGGRVIITRGLLAKVRSLDELKSLLKHAASLADGVYKSRVAHNMNEATEEILSVPQSPYDPESASIRLARMFAEEACDQECVALAQSASGLAKADPSALPESVKRLFLLQPGYDLAAKARKSEKSDDHGQAIANYLQAAAITPDEPRILVSLGLAYLRVGQLQTARMHLQKAARLQPDYYKTQMGLGYLYLKQGELSQARELLSSSVRLLPVTENLFLLAETRERSGDTAGALVLYRFVVEFDRYSKLGRTSAGRIKQLKGD